MRRREIVVGVLCLAFSVTLLRLIPVLFGTPQPMVHVTWRDVDRSEREALEQRFHLSEAAELGAGRWGYVPLDTTRDTLQQLVLDPNVADTDGIDRRLFRIAKRGPLTARRGGIVGSVPFAAPAAKLIAGVLTVAGAGLLLLGVAASRGWSFRSVRRAVRSGWSHALTRGIPVASAEAAGIFRVVFGRVRRIVRNGWSDALTRGIPVASAEAAGIFRVVFGSLVLIYLVRNPVYPALLEPYELGRAAGAYGNLVRWLAEHPHVVEWLDPSVKLVGGLFVLGVVTPLAYAAFVALFLVWASVYTLQTSHHVVSAIGVALVCLLPARWGDAWSVDAWLLDTTATGRRSLPSKRYGFVLWVPVLVLGVTFMAAAESKLRDGLDWILNGTVRYHFISDLEHAWVPWGPWLTRHDVVAVPLSAVVVVVESLVLTAAFSRSDRYRLVIGACAACLLAGFALLQGIVWPGWWILLVGFLPWHRIRGAALAGAAEPTSAASISLLQRAAVSLVIVVQIYVSAARIEARPIVSAYDMYATTYGSDEEYELASNLRYRIVAVTPGGTFRELGCDIDDEAARVLTKAADGGSAERARMRPRLAECLKDKPDVQYVALEGDRQVFDWNTGKFVWKRRIDHIGPVPVGWLWN